MAESDPVQRLKAAARRAAGPVAVETQQRWYMEELEQTIGRDASGSAWQPERGSSGPKWIGPVITIFLVAAVSFAATAAVLLWKDGTLGRFFVEKQIVPRHTAPRWVLGDAETGRPSPIATGKGMKSDAPPNEIEPLVQPAPPPAPKPTAPEETPAE